ncbi:MAG: SBBP repeat-containing protein [Bacteroidales bacterium]|nr:SBBP repeat-containing protein [Bacteroidales bacterium]
MKTTLNTTMIVVITIVINIFSAIAAFGQCYTWKWASNSDSPDYSMKWDFAKDIATDNSNDLIVVGEFTAEELVFGTTVLTNSAVNRYEIFVAKFDESGNVLWAKNAVGSQDDFVTSVATDQNGDIYVTGYFNSLTIDFGTKTLTNTGLNDVFIVKYNGDTGEVMWAKSVVGAGDDYAMDLSCDYAGNIYVTGYFNQDDNLTFGSIILTKPCHNQDMFLAKYNSAGNVQWALCAEESYWGGAKGLSLTTDNESNIYVTGTYQWESISFGTTTLSYDIGNGEQMYLAKYNTSGTPIWAKKATGVNNYGGNANAPRCVEADNEGNVYVTGYFDVDEISFGTLSLSSGTVPAADVFLVKYSSAGNPLWLRGASASGMSNNYGKSVYPDKNGNVYLTGNFSSTSIGFGSVVLNNANTNNSPDIFIVKYDGTGNIKWAESYGGSEDDEAASILMNDYDNIYFCGSFKSASLSLDATTLANKGGASNNYDLLIGKLKNSITPSFNVSDVLCYGGNDGSIDLTLSNGTSPYGINWSSGQVVEDISNLIAGNYKVTITDANECVKIDSTIVNQPDQLLSNVISTTNVTCYGGSNGSIDLDVSGGTIPYSYHWSDLSSTQDIVDITAGNYQVTITDNNDCTITESAVITQPAEIIISDGNITNISCYGEIDGGISITIEGGEIPYTCEWSNGAFGQTISNLQPNNYTVTITDANFCIKNETFTVTQPDILESSISSSDVLCFGGSDGGIVLTPIGGTEPYSFIWSNGSNEQNPANLSIGTYTVTISDSNDCTTINSAEINQPTELLIDIISIVDVKCFGDNSGSININVSGGVSPYVYEWSNGSNQEDINNILANQYFVTVTDTHECTVVVDAIVLQPDEITLSVIDITNVSCYGEADGAIDIEISNGYEPYTCEWSNSAITPDIDNLVAGTYILTITDSENCTKIETLEILQPEVLESSIDVNDVLCYEGEDGSIDLTVTGGTVPYSFLWSNGESTEGLNGLIVDNYSVTITDDNDCSTINSGEITQPDELLTDITIINQVTCFGANDGEVILNVTGGISPYSFLWSNGSDEQNISDLIAGEHFVTITDYNACSTINSVEITQPDEIEITYTVSDVICYGGNSGQIDLLVLGGVAPYVFDWSNGANTEDISGINAGVYIINVTDQNSCAQTTEIIVNQPDALELSFITNHICWGEASGEIDLSVSGGVGTYSYSWSNGALTEDIAELIAGEYHVTVTDDNACTTTNFTAILQATTPIEIVAESSDVLCYGENTGSIALSVTGSVPPYLYLWSNESETAEIDNLSIGSYTVTVTDFIACTETVTVFIDEPDPLNINFTFTNTDCYGLAGGNIDIDVSGGIAPYTYYWTNGASTEDIDELNAGFYSVFIVDNNNCVINESAEITQPEPLSVSFEVQNTCFGHNNGNIISTVIGGTAPYSFLWDNDDELSNIENLSASTYILTITDNNNCEIISSANVEETDAEIEIEYSSTDVLCYGENTGSIELLLIGGSAPYSIQWSNGANTETINNLSAGDYNVTVSDNFGCITTNNILINETSELLIDFDMVIDSAGNCQGQLTAIVEGGTFPYSYNWYDPQMQTTMVADSLCGGYYFVIVHDSNNCSASDIAFVETGTAGVALLNSQIGIEVFPNPAKDVLYIDFTDGTNFVLKIFSITGQIVMEKLLHDGVNAIDISTIGHKGIFLLQIFNQNGKLVYVAKQVIK